MINSNKLIASNDRLVKRAGIILLVTVAIFVIWSSTVSIDSASVSSGMVVVESSRKPIEHLEGGIVSQVYIKEGQRVKVGDPLLKLSDISYRNRLRQAQLTYISEQLNYQSLKAERDHLVSFEPQVDPYTFPNLSLEISTLINSQHSQFESNVQMKQKELAMLDSRLMKAKQLVVSLKSRLEQQTLAQTFLADEIEMHNKLLKDGYTSRLRVLELKRAEVLLNSDILSIQSELDSAVSSIAELSQQKSAIEGRNRSNLEKALSESRNRILTLESELRTVQDLQERTVLKSPSNGIVLGLKVNSAGEVVQPGESIMEIIPNHDSLIIESLIAPKDIDSVHLGLKAVIRLSAYNSRVTPVVHGEVVYLDADRTVVHEGGNTVSGYKIKIKLNKEELDNNSEFKLYPGMPADVYVLLKSKHPIDYFIEPLVDSLFKAFRET